MCSTLREQKNNVVLHNGSDSRDPVEGGSLIRGIDIDSGEKAAASATPGEHSAAIKSDRQGKDKRRTVDPVALAELASCATAIGADASLDYGPDMVDRIRGVTFVLGVEGGDEMNDVPVGAAIKTGRQSKQQRRTVDPAALAELASRATAIGANASLDYGPDMADRIRGVTFVRGVEGGDEMNDVPVGAAIKTGRQSKQQRRMVDPATLAEHVSRATAIGPDASFDHGPNMADCIRGVTFVRGVGSWPDEWGELHTLSGESQVALGIGCKEEVATVTPPRTQSVPKNGADSDRVGDAPRLGRSISDDCARGSRRDVGLSGQRSGGTIAMDPQDDVPRALIVGPPGRSLRRLGQ